MTHTLCGRFLTSLQTEDLPGDRWRLTAPLVYQTISGESITVPAGFECDLTSGVDEAGDWDWAGCVHDFLYRSAAVNGRSITRGFADGILGECCHACAPDGTPLKVASSQGWFLKVFIRPTGWLAWRKWRTIERRGTLNILTGRLEEPAVTL